MNGMRPIALVLCVLVMAVMGCRGGGPIYNVKDAPATTASGRTPSLEQMQKAIVTAGVGLGWQMSVAKPGAIIATLNLRSHQAVVSITFTTKHYSIHYKDSKNLKYDAATQTIHENYASWIQRLDGAIRTRLTAADM